MRDIPQLAIVIPCFNEELCIETTVNRLFEVFNDLISKNKIRKDSYLYLVDDGSSDKTWEIIERLHSQNNLVKGMKFIKNYGNQKALLAGMEGVNDIGCDCAITMDADLQQDITTLEEFIDGYLEGAEMVFGVKRSRDADSFFKKWTALMFYKTMNILGAKIPVNHSDYRLVSKRVLDIMKQFPEKYLFLRGFFHDIGLKSKVVNFDVQPRIAGKSKFNFASLMGLALSGITSYSIIPLRIVAVLGFFMALLAFLTGVETIFEKIFLHNSPAGWATQVILLCAFGGIQLFCLGIIGEYVGQLYREVKSRPRYIKDIELR